MLENKAAQLSAESYQTLSDIIDDTTSPDTALLRLALVHLRATFEIESLLDNSIEHHLGVARVCAALLSTPIVATLSQQYLDEGCLDDDQYTTESIEIFNWKRYHNRYVLAFPNDRPEGPDVVNADTGIIGTCVYHKTHWMTTAQEFMNGVISCRRCQLESYTGYTATIGDEPCLDLPD